MWMIAIMFVASSLLLPAVGSAKQDVLKDPQGKTLALILDCNTCPDGKGSQCTSGAETGFNGNASCGHCLLKANFGTRINYDFDLLIMGHLKDEKGQPAKGRFVKLFLPNTWTVRTRTGDDGLFRLLLGATGERKGKPIIVQIGDRIMPKDSKAEHYALFMVPEQHKPCETSGVTKQ
jgi:hypothetical protein